LTGVNAIETKAGEVTVRVTGALWTPPYEAVIMVVPTPMVVASPALEPLLKMVATLTADEAHAAEVVTSCVVLSLNLEIAVNC
jgi:hypothetical protein